MRLHYFVKVKIRVFVKIPMLEKRNSRNLFLLTLIYLLRKDATFWLLHHIIANLCRKTCTKLYQNRPRFVRDMTKTFWCVFRFTVLTAVHLQNTNAKFHKVEQRHYSGEAETFTFLYDSLLRTICTKFYHNRSGFVDCISKTFRCFFSVQSVYTCVCRYTGWAQWNDAKTIWFVVLKHVTGNYYMWNEIISKLFQMLIAYAYFRCSFSNMFNVAQIILK